MTLKRIFIYSTCWLVLIFLISNSAFAQEEIEISGVKYVLHIVSKNETVYNLCQKYKVTQQELMQANPGLTAVLKTGTTVKIPQVKKADAVIQNTSIPKPKMEDVEYYYHKVTGKQTLTSISRQYGITSDELIRYNPELSKGFIIGQVLQIPVKISRPGQEPAEQSVTSINPNNDESIEYIIHQVVSGETIYSLGQKYQTDNDELLKLNPALQDGLKAGMKLRIPNHSGQIPVLSLLTDKDLTPHDSDGTKLNSKSSNFEPDSQNGNCNPILGKNEQKFKVAILLPLDLPGNNPFNVSLFDKENLLQKINSTTEFNDSSSDTTTTVGGTKIDLKLEGFLEFYEGVLLAADSLKREGMNLELYVFDEGNEKMISALLKLEIFKELDLIIGPVYPEHQSEIAAFAEKNKIVLISPLSPTGKIEETNPWFVKVNPSKEYQIEQTAEYIRKELSGKNLILMQLSGNSDSPDARFGQLVKESMAGNSTHLFHEYNFQKQGVNSIKSLLDQTGENIFIIPTDNEVQVSVAVTNLNALAEHYNIVLIGTSSLMKMKSIQTESFHRIRLRYLSPHFIDYTKPFVRKFVGSYRVAFSSEPTQFSFQGYDVACYFLSALYHYGKDFRKCLPDFRKEMTQMFFNFRITKPMGGMMNHALFVTSYERNFEILNYGIISPNQ